MKQMRLKDLELTNQLSLELIEMKQYCRNLAEASNRTTTYHVNIIQTLKNEMATLRQEIEQHTRSFNKKPTISPTLSKTEGTTHSDIAERNISCPVQIPLESDHTQANKQKQTYADMVKLSPPKGHAIPVIVSRQYNQYTTLCVQDTTDENVLPYQTNIVTKPKVSNNFPLAVDNNNMHSEHSSKPYTRGANKENLENRYSKVFAQSTHAVTTLVASQKIRSTLA
ncbi:hypothetical protein DPMN_148969 [Dreissena polymorpha]|uniref:Uncharacterized protein n=1 Tax=Dreissena polymorpha TaxID=45954 RepID=A0A9D4FCW7_DREPO|nr:hypothetical protein DPMN_148969 [Dreissena polymorpha]